MKHFYINYNQDRQMKRAFINVKEAGLMKDVCINYKVY